MTLTHAQMLALWRRAAGLEESRSDCSIEQFGGLDSDAAIATAMRQWYLNLLDTAPLRHLQLTDIAAGLQLKADSEVPGKYSIQLPANVRRACSLVLVGSVLSVPILESGSVASPDMARLAALQANPFSRAGALRPVAVRSGSTVTLFSASQAVPVLSRLWAVVDPGDETYVMDESALSLLPNPYSLDPCKTSN